MKYIALTPIKHDGKDVDEGDTIALGPLDAKRLLAIGAIAEQDGKGKDKDKDKGPAGALAVSVPPQDPGLAPDSAASVIAADK